MPDEWSREELLGLSSAFMKCRILLSAAELDLFSKLGRGPVSVEDLCATEGWSPRGLRILLDALVTQGLVESHPTGSYQVQAELSELMSKDAGNSILPLVLHRVNMWKTWSNLTEIVKTGFNPNPMGTGSRSAEEMEAFIGAMNVIGLKVAEDIARAFDLKRFRRMLDIGGASGTYAEAFLKQSPDMTATIFDLPKVIEIAARRLAGSEFRRRIALVEGDYTSDSLPPGHDIALLSAVIHINGREANRRLFCEIHRVLEPGGTLLIRDYLLDETRTRPPEGAIFAVNMLVATREGNSHSLRDVREDLEFAGFRDVRMVREGMNMDQLLAADK